MWNHVTYDRQWASQIKAEEKALLKCLQQKCVDDDNLTSISQQSGECQSEASVKTPVSVFSKKVYNLK